MGKIIEIKVPQMGESITSATVAGWRIKENDNVNANAILVDLETDKVTMEIPTPISGVLKKILKTQGTNVLIGEVLCTIEEGTGAGGATAGGVGPSVGAPASGTVAGDKGSVGGATADGGSPTPASDIGGAVGDGVALSNTIGAKSVGSKNIGGEIQNENSNFSPSAERLIKENNLDYSKIQGTGIHNQILKSDVINFISNQKVSNNTNTLENTNYTNNLKEIENTNLEKEKIVPMSRLRLRIAERLVQAKQTAAILTTFNEVDMTNVMELRKKYKDSFTTKYGVPLGFMSIFIKAAIYALKAVPSVNAEIRDTNIIYKNFYDISVAVSGPKGLVVPVIRNADNLDFAEIEIELARLAEKVKKGNIELSDLEGGTFTISNGGIFGSMLSTPILNPPQVAILGMHNIVKRAVVVNDQIVIRPIMYLALSYDHRLIDGKEAVTFLVKIKDVIENPATLLLGV